MSSDLRSELERKRARLAALKEGKARKERLKAEETENVPPKLIEPSDIRNEADEILRSLNLNEQVPSLNGLAPKETAVQRVKKKHLSISGLNHTDIVPKVQVSYNKEVQTMEDRGSFDDDPEIHHGYGDVLFNNDWDFDTTGIGYFNDSLGNESRLPNVSLVPAKLTDIDEQIVKQSKKNSDSLAKTQYSSEEVKTIEASVGYLEFLRKAANRVIKCLEAPSYIYKDYTGADLDDDKDSTQRQLITPGSVYFDETWSKNRCISALNWSVMHPELMAVSYLENVQATHEPSGIVLIWNSRFDQLAPESVLYSQSPVTDVIFAPFHPNLIIGGTHAGIVNIWDTRVYRRLPVMSTNLSSPHSQRIRALKAGGSTNAPVLRSLSSDGILATWSLDMLSAPQETIDLNNNNVKSMVPMCMSQMQSPSVKLNMLIGSESGDAFLVDVINFSSTNNSSNSTAIKSTFSGHSASVFAIKSHPFSEITKNYEFENLFLTASEDFSVQLWSVENPGQPLHTFTENFEPVLDCDWSPIHPAIFASVDMSSELFLWNVNTHPEEPLGRLRCERRGAFFSSCLFHPTGSQIVCGDSRGHVQLFHLNEQQMTPRTEDWTAFNMWISQSSNRLLSH